MKMILELGTMEAKNAVTSGALLGMLEVMADFEKATEAPAREMAHQFNEPARPQYPQPPVQPQYQQPVQQQPIYPTSMPGTAVNPQPPTGPIQQQMQPTAPVQQPTTQTAVPTALVPTAQAPAYTMDQLAVAATQLVDAGKRDALLTILANFGVQALTELPKDRYGEFATALRQQGVKI